ncbi:MAG TPA: hypothetical protein VF141_13510 [Chryseolinea sp.]
MKRRAFRNVWHQGERCIVMGGIGYEFNFRCNFYDSVTIVIIIKRKIKGGIVTAGVVFAFTTIVRDFDNRQMMEGTAAIMEMDQHSHIESHVKQREPYDRN